VIDINVRFKKQKRQKKLASLFMA